MIMYICYLNTKVNALTKHKYESTLTPVRVPQASVDNHTYTYNKIGKLATINQDILDYELTYGVNEQRIEAIKKEYGQVVYTKQYINTASMEVKNGEELTYLYAEGQPFAIHKKTIEDEEEMYYLHLDHLGSIMSITNQSSSIVETRSYDAWGRPQDPNTWSYQLTPFGALNITDRGYTFHEHLIEFSLINMNGRMYDPVLGRVISPDNYIQAPDNTQSFNRYSYCFNNPLKYSDPSGDIVWTAVTGVVDFFATALFKGGLDPTSSNSRSTAWSNYDPTASWSNTNKAWKIDNGLYKTDPNKSFWGQSWELISRFTWQLPQTALGYGVSGIHNLLGGVKSVSYYGGATVVESYSERWGGITIGNYINGQRGIKADPNNWLFQHEYGHYIQSQAFGWFYFSKVGIPSLLSKDPHDLHPAEQDANTRALKYFNEHENGLRWDFDYNPIKGYNPILPFNHSQNQAALRNGKLSLSWYDFLLYPTGFVFSGLVNTLILNGRY